MVWRTISVYDIYEDSDGYLWFGTGKGITRYKRSGKKPSVRIVSIQTDEKYTDLTAIPPITAKNRVTIEYQAIDFKTSPEKRQYQCRIYESSNHATRNTKYEIRKDTQFGWKPNKPGTYIFEVQSIDRDLNYSETASVTLKVIPPWYLNGWIAFPSGGAILAFLVYQYFLETACGSHQTGAINND